MVLFGSQFIELKRLFLVFRHSAQAILIKTPKRILRIRIAQIRRFLIPLNSYIFHGRGIYISRFAENAQSIHRPRVSGLRSFAIPPHRQRFIRFNVVKAVFIAFAKQKHRLHVTLFGRTLIQLQRFLFVFIEQGSVLIPFADYALSMGISILSCHFQSPNGPFFVYAHDIPRPGIHHFQDFFDRFFISKFGRFQIWDKFIRYELVITMFI